MPTQNGTHPSQNPQENSPSERDTMRVQPVWAWPDQFFVFKPFLSPLIDEFSRSMEPRRRKHCDNFDRSDSAQTELRTRLLKSVFNIQIPLRVMRCFSESRGLF
jgi:hypothetical protein